MYDVIHRAERADRVFQKAIDGTVETDDQRPEGGVDGPMVPAIEHVGVVDAVPAAALVGRNATRDPLHQGQEKHGDDHEGRVDEDAPSDAWHDYGLVLGGAIDAIDDKDLGELALGIELQPELLLECREDRWCVGIGEIASNRRLRGERHLDVIGPVTPVRSTTGRPRPLR